MIQEGAHDGLAFCVRFVRESRWKWWMLTGRGIDKNHNSNSHLHSTFQVSRHLDIFTSLDSSYGLIVRPGINYYPPSREETAERRDGVPVGQITGCWPANPSWLCRAGWASVIPALSCLAFCPRSTKIPALISEILCGLGWIL